MLEGLLINFRDVLKLPEAAIEWLLALYTAIQVFDDAADGDVVNRQELDNTIWFVFIGQFQNQFFVEKQSFLLPLISQAILKWQASDRMEREGKANAKSYMWRAGYFDIVLSVVQICHGAAVAHEVAHLIPEIYDETLEDYLKEFDHA